MILVVALATLSAGCFGGGAKQLSPEEAEAVSQEALETFAADFASPTGGSLTTVAGEFGFGKDSTDTATFAMEWGRGGSASVILSTGGSFGVDLKLFCGPGSIVIVIGEQAVEARPQPDKACMESFQDTGDPLDLGEFENLDLLNITAHPDGTVTARYTDEDGTVTIAIDAKGRVSRMDIDTESGTGFLDMGYGERRTITVPQADERMPALINGFGDHNGQVYQWNGLGGDETQPFSEFEVRVIDAESQEVVATFPVGENGEANGFTFMFTDDGDGVFDGGDSFSISREGWNTVNQYEVVVWDRWADRALGDVPIPSLGAWVFVGLLGAALLARRV